MSTPPLRGCHGFAGYKNGQIDIVGEMGHVYMFPRLLGLRGRSNTPRMQGQAWSYLARIQETRFSAANLFVFVLLALYVDLIVLRLD